VILHWRFDQAKLGLGLGLG